MFEVLRPDSLNQIVYAMIIDWLWPMSVDTSAIEDVVNLTNRISINASFELVQNSWLKWRDCIVMRLAVRVVFA